MLDRPVEVFLSDVMNNFKPSVTIVITKISLSIFWR